MSKATRGWRRQQAKAAARAALLDGDPLVVGLDLAESGHFARAETSSGRPLEQRLLRSPDQETRWWQGVEKMRRPGQRVLVGMEPTGATWKLMWVEVERLGYRPLLVQPLAVRRAGEQLDYQRAKSDPRDAELICRLVRQGDVCRTRLPQEPWASLRSLATKRWQLSRLQGAARQEVRSQLQLVFPAYLRVVRTLDGLTSQAMLRAGVDPTRLRHLEVEQWEAEVAAELGPTRMARWLVRAVHQVCPEPGGLASERHAGLWRIRDAAERWHLLQGQIARLDAELTRLLQDTPYAQVAQGWRGLSTAMLANLLGLVGDPADYDDARCLVRMAGLNPRPWSSGGFVGHTMLSYAGRAELRTAAHQIVLCLVRHDPAFRARYRYLIERPERRLAKPQALCALAAKLLRTLWCLAVHDQPYEVSRAWPGGVPLLVA
jgi:transposase